MKSTDKYSIESTDYTIGQDNIQKWGFDVHNPVFGISSTLIICFLFLTLVFDSATVNSVLGSIKSTIIHQFDLLFLCAANVFLLFCIGLAVSPFGKIRLGGKKARAKYSFLSWIAMLFAAGMGIGLMFYSVAEPAMYFSNFHQAGTPLDVAASTAEAREVALAATLFHWGLHPWAIYGVVALSLAFFSFNKGLPLSIRSIFYPLLGDRAWGWAGHIIDILTVLATLFGLATTLGLGAQQAASGISYIFGWSSGLGMQSIVIVVVTLLAIASVVRGVDGGVVIVSHINMALAFLLLLSVFSIGTSVSVDSIYTTFTSYARYFVALSDPFNRPDKQWMDGFTVSYWAWWIAWSPFVGIFIARVSYGRTIRQFIGAVLIVPTMVTIAWMGTFGGMGLEQLIKGIGVLGQSGLTDITLVLFQMFDELQFGHLLSGLAIILVLVFFVTSSDSGSLVIDSITAGGKVDTPILQRAFWAIIEGAIAMALLWVGGTEAISALQAGVISVALPFVFILLLMCISLLLGLTTEK